MWIGMARADRVAFEFRPLRLVPFDIRQARDAMPPQTPMQRGSRQVGDGRLQGIKALVQWQLQAEPPAAVQALPKGRRRQSLPPPRSDGDNGFDPGSRHPDLRVPRSEDLFLHRWLFARARPYPPPALHKSSGAHSWRMCGPESEFRFRSFPERFLFCLIPVARLIALAVRAPDRRVHQDQQMPGCGGPILRRRGQGGGRYTNTQAGQGVDRLAMSPVSRVPTLVWGDAPGITPGRIQPICSYLQVE